MTSTRSHVSRQRVELVGLWSNSDTDDDSSESSPSPSSKEKRVVARPRMSTMPTSFSQRGSVKEGVSVHAKRDGSSAQHGSHHHKKARQGNGEFSLSSASFCSTASSGTTYLPSDESPQSQRSCLSDTTDDNEHVPMNYPVDVVTPYVSRIIRARLRSSEYSPLLPRKLRF